MDQLNFTSNVDTLFKSLEDFTQKEGIIGKPVTQGDKTFLPVVSITMGYGGGNANMKGQSNAPGMGTGSATGTGAMGLGAKLCTDAVIVIDGQNVSVLPMNAAGAATSLMDKIPQIISGMKQGQNQGQSLGQNQEQPQNQAQNQNQNQTPAMSK